jgi:arginase
MDDRDVAILGVPMDLGSDRRGVDMGPSAIRYAGLEAAIRATGRACWDDGDLSVPRPEPLAREDSAGDTASHLEEILSVCGRVRDRVGALIAEKTLPVILGGDHSIAIGTVSGAAETAEIGLLWFDAHGDFNTPQTSPSTNVHGMSLAALLGIGSFGTDASSATNVDQEHVALIGVRELDPGERDQLRESDITVYTMAEVDERGLGNVTRDAIAQVSRAQDGVHVSLDMDVLDPTEAAGVGTPVRGGVTYREAHIAMEQVATLGERLRSFDVVEVNPTLDTENATAELAVELTASALGKRIL